MVLPSKLRNRVSGKLGRMSRILLALVFLASLLPAAGNPGPFKSTARSAKVTIDAELYLDRGQVEKLIGNSLDGYLVVVKVKIASNRPNEEIRLFRDDFVLVSSKDGERSEPFAPEMLAGSSTMVVNEVVLSTGPIMGQNTGPVIGGIPGGGPVPTGPPRRIDTPGSQGGTAGSPTASATTVEQKIYDGKPGNQQTAWLETLKAKVLKEGELTQAHEGLLYFPLNGKHKPKQITLLYNGVNPRMELTFSDK
ncbi:MAG: hypothetical protein IT169_13475 [Bryobacterales bacterium]|nr:hypothetical protein [Bryobacterales bacterium]